MPKSMRLLLFFLFSIKVWHAHAQTIPSSSNANNIDSSAQIALQKQVYWSAIKPKGWVNDFEKLFTAEQIQAIESSIVTFEKATSIEIALLSVDSNYIPASQFDDFALYLANSWGIGKKDKDNGILIAISKNHRRIRICNGKGIAELSDMETKRIIDSAFVPAFKKGDYYEGTLNGLNAIMSELQATK